MFCFPSVSLAVKSHVLGSVLQGFFTCSVFQAFRRHSKAKVSQVFYRIEYAMLLWCCIVGAQNLNVTCLAVVCYVFQAFRWHSKVEVSQAFYSIEYAMLLCCSVGAQIMQVYCFAVICFVFQTFRWHSKVAFCGFGRVIYIKKSFIAFHWHSKVTCSQVFYRSCL